MNIEAETYGDTVMLILKGELTADSLGVFSQGMEHQLENREIIDVVLDLANVPFIDSATLEYLLDLQDRLAERLGQIKLVRCDANVRKILEITRLEQAFEIFEDPAEAVKAIRT